MIFEFLTNSGFFKDTKVILHLSKSVFYSIKDTIVIFESTMVVLIFSRIQFKDGIVILQFRSQLKRQQYPNLEKI